ncbi:formate/nitrite transporter family protein [Bernardetia sp. ABR2-2B]|uniref:formate/nitrite transporter family protein n=1 Tax=Bernardetia sp. ABR2-2B TaxID=3127472 RepID=UPI0030D2230A
MKETNKKIQEVLEQKENQQKQESEIHSDQAKSADEILEEEIQIGLHEHKRPPIRLFFSAFSAGLEVGFSVFLLGIFHHLFAGSVSESTLTIILALGYTIGFIFIVIGRSELFTEHTTLATLPVLNKLASVKSLGKVWGVVYAGNILGGYLFALMLMYMVQGMNLMDMKDMEEIALKLTKPSSIHIFVSAIIAGWLMGLLSWLVTASKETISRIFIVTLITAVIGIAHLHHSIVGSIEVFAGFLLSDKISFMDYLRVQGISTLGNAIGGVVFVAVLKYAHVRPNEKNEDRFSYFN